MKHAYLIIAHHEFELLGKLIFALDDVRNDIYIHFDQKLTCLPEIKTKFATLFLITDRVDVRWGDISQIETEILLFKSAYNGGLYAYYHLLSGVDMPIKSQDYIHRFFLEHSRKEFIGFTSGNISKEIDRKVRKYHLFPKYYRSTTGIANYLRRFARFLAIRIQYFLGVKRYRSAEYKKGASWVSVTNSFVEFLLLNSDKILKTYHHTFCADEIFIQSLCWNSHFRDNIFDIENEERGCMRKIGWQDNELVAWQIKDYDDLISSDALFARKFNGSDQKIVDKILEEILPR